MVKVDLKDEQFLQLSAAATGAYGVHFFGWPRQAQDYHFSALEPKSNTSARWLGFALAQSAVMTYVGSLTTDRTIKKNLLKAQGACWGAAALHSTYNVRKKHQKEQRGWTSTAVEVGMAGLLLWRGLKKDDAAV